jgi:hypothetical protein
MGQWSWAFKSPATSFSHTEHPQAEQRLEMLVKIGKQMTNLNLDDLHVDVMEATFPRYKSEAFDPPANDLVNFPILI